MVLMGNIYMLIHLKWFTYVNTFRRVKSKSCKYSEVFKGWTRKRQLGGRVGFVTRRKTELFTRKRPVKYMYLSTLYTEESDLLQKSKYVLRRT